MATYKIELFSDTDWPDKFYVEYQPLNPDGSIYAEPGAIKHFYVDSLTDIRPTPAEMESEGK